MRFEVISPAVPSRMVQTNDVAGLRIDTTQIGSLLQIAPQACQSEIAAIVYTTVLLRNNVLNVMGEFAFGLMQKAILATVVRSFPHQLPSAGIHSLPGQQGELPSGFLF